MFKRFILSKSTKINLIKLNNNVNNTLFKKHIATVAASSSSRKPVVLCILDGWGLSSSSIGNAPEIANTPILDKIKFRYPNAKLITHGPDVGLPEGQMGNSEVGHTNIGAGRVVEMDLGKINATIQDQTFLLIPTYIDFPLVALFFAKCRYFFSL